MPSRSGSTTPTPAPDPHREEEILSQHGPPPSQATQPSVTQNTQQEEVSRDEQVAGIRAIFQEPKVASLLTDILGYILRNRPVPLETLQAFVGSRLLLLFTHPTPPGSNPHGMEMAWPRTPEEIQLAVGVQKLAHSLLDDPPLARRLKGIQPQYWEDVGASFCREREKAIRVAVDEAAGQALSDLTIQTQDTKNGTDSEDKDPRTDLSLASTNPYITDSGHLTTTAPTIRHVPAESSQNSWTEPPETHGSSEAERAMRDAIEELRLTEPR
jgi:hypothetical protein